MDKKPQIVLHSNEGYHNSISDNENLRKNAYKDLSTICIVPTRGVIPAKVVQSWMGLMSPMNQKFVRMFAIGMEVGAAYSETIESIISHPELSKFKYILTLEEDNTPPPDGLIKLYENMDKYDVIGGLYWTKGIEGKPMCYGKPDVFPVNFVPFMPETDTVTRCNGLGMGFTLFKMEIFKNKKLPKPFWYKQISKKYRYIYILTNKKEKKKILSTLKYNPRQYPKSISNVDNKITKYE